MQVLPSADNARGTPSNVRCLGAAHAYFGRQPEGPRLAKHPPVRFDKGMAVDQLA